MSCGRSFGLVRRLALLLRLDQRRPSSPPLVGLLGRSPSQEGRGGDVLGGAARLAHASKTPPLTPPPCARGPWLPRMPSLRSLWTKARGEIEPVRIRTLDQVDLPIPRLALQHLLPVDGRSRLIELLVIDEPVHTIAPREALDDIVAVPEDAAPEIAGHADIERSIGLARKGHVARHRACRTMDAWHKARHECDRKFTVSRG